jgi:hypothetical protein
MTDDLREAFRSLLLPIDPVREKDAIEAAQAVMAARGIEASDQAEFIRVELTRTKSGHGVHMSLSALVTEALRAGDPDWGPQLGPAYYELHEAVLQERHLMSFEEASSFLSHARLIAQLAAEESMSAAQIARVLSARDHRVTFTWQAVQAVLSRLSLRRSLNSAAVQELFERDAQFEERVFADADFADAASIVGRVGAEFGFPDDLESLLLRLFQPDPADGTRHGPYLQILHYQCVIAEYFDHALTVLYEFAPRGAVAEWVFARYPGDLSGAGNPFLNNAKSVDRLDAAWARSKDWGLLSPATALFAIVAGLEDMGFAARQELAGWLRQWLLRIIRLTRPLAHEVPGYPTAEAVGALLGALVAEETRTAGIIEQRVVDAVALTATWSTRDGGVTVWVTQSMRATSVGASSATASFRTPQRASSWHTRPMPGTSLRST